MANILVDKVNSIGGLVIEIWSEDLGHAISGHPEVTIDKIKETLSEPSKVIKSRSSSNACLFYSVVIQLRESECLYFCVVVAVTKIGKGKMITAYDADFIKSGIELYSKS
jgi:hypothetical protein